MSLQTTKPLYCYIYCYTLLRSLTPSKKLTNSERESATDAGNLEIIDSEEFISKMWIGTVVT